MLKTFSEVREGELFLVEGDNTVWARISPTWAQQDNGELRQFQAVTIVRVDD